MSSSNEGGGPIFIVGCFLMTLPIKPQAVVLGLIISAGFGRKI